MQNIVGYAFSILGPWAKSVECGLSRGEGRPTIVAGQCRLVCSEASLSLPFGTENLFLLIGEELLEARLFVRLGNELFERSRLLWLWMPRRDSRLNLSM